MGREFKAGETVVIARNTGAYNRYYHGGETNDVKLKSKGKIVSIESKEKIRIELADGRRWFVHSNELDSLERSLLSSKLGTLPKHPVFEIAEHAPVFLVEGRAYTVGEGEDNAGQFVEKGFFGSNRRPLVDMGDFASLDALFLDRASLEIETIGKEYAKELVSELDSLRRLDGTLDTPQAIYKLIFPYLQQDRYKNQVATLIDVNVENSLNKKRDEVNGDSNKLLEEIANAAYDEVKNEIDKIENRTVKDTRSKTKKALDLLLGYKEPVQKESESKSLLENALAGREIAIIEGAMYHLVPDNSTHKRKVQVNGKVFGLVESKVQNFGKGAKVKIKPNTQYSGQTSDVGIMQAEFGDTARDREGDWARVVFSNGYTNNYRREDLELVDAEGLVGGLEKAFSDELEKRIKVDSLRANLSKEIILDMLKTQNTELLEIAGKKEYNGDGFGFVQDEKGRYYVYLDVPAFAIKSQFDNNHYLFGKTRIATMVDSKHGELIIDHHSDPVLIDNNNHPFLHNVQSRFARICIGRGGLPTSGRDNGEVVVKRLRKGKEILMYGYLGFSYDPSYKLSSENKYFDRNRVNPSELDKDVPIIVGGQEE